jgi:acetolactate synthase I/II/III large subunit
MTGTEFLLRCLHDQGLSHVFLVPGGHIDPLVAGLGVGTSKLQPIVAAHEEGAGFMADGYARVSGKFGACMCIGGPGAGNILPAAIAAMSDRSRVLFITGDVPTTLQGRGAFQDGSMEGTRDSEYLHRATNFSEEVELISQFPRQLAAAFRAMGGVPPGPVHLTIPTDLQQAELPSDTVFPSPSAEPSRPVDVSALVHACERVLAGAGKLAVLAGRGCVSSGACDQLRTFAEKYEVPVVTTFAAKGVLPYDHKLCLGMFGYAGTNRAISALLGGDLDVLLVLGSSMNLRDTLFWSRELSSRTQVIQIDIDPTMLGRDYPVPHTIVGDCRQTLEQLCNFADSVLKPLVDSKPARKDWTAKLKALPAHFDTDNQTSNAAPIHPARLISEMRRALPRDTILFVDSGAHRAFAGHYWESFGSGGVRSATNLGPMGWAIPAAIGGKLARPDVPVVVITGDGCMRMHGMEIATAARYRVPVIFVVSNNSALGNVYLRARKENAGAAEMTLLPDIDWAAFGRVIGAEGARVENPNDLAAALHKAMSSSGPYVLDVVTQRDCLTPVSPYNTMAAEYAHAHHD